MKWTRDPNSQIFADDTKARVKSHIETRELRLAVKSKNEIQTGKVMKAKFFVCFHVTVLYFLFLQKNYHFWLDSRLTRDSRLTLACGWLEVLRYNSPRNEDNAIR